MYSKLYTNLFSKGKKKKIQLHYLLCNGRRWIGHVTLYGFQEDAWLIDNTEKGLDLDHFFNILFNVGQYEL